MCILLYMYIYAYINLYVSMNVCVSVCDLASWELFSESSHSPFVEEPAKFSRIVEEFLRGCD